MERDRGLRRRNSSSDEDQERDRHRNSYDQLYKGGSPPDSEEGKLLYSAYHGSDDEDTAKDNSAYHGSDDEDRAGYSYISTGELPESYVDVASEDIPRQSPTNEKQSATEGVLTFSRQLSSDLDDELSPQSSFLLEDYSPSLREALVDEADANDDAKYDAPEHTEPYSDSTAKSAQLSQQSGFRLEDYSSSVREAFVDETEAKDDANFDEPEHTETYSPTASADETLGYPTVTSSNDFTRDETAYGYDADKTYTGYKSDVSSSPIEEPEESWFKPIQTAEVHPSAFKPVEPSPAARIITTNHGLQIKIYVGDITKAKVESVVTSEIPTLSDKSMVTRALYSLPGGVQFKAKREGQTRGKLSRREVYVLDVSDCFRFKYVFQAVLPRKGLDKMRPGELCRYLKKLYRNICKKADEKRICSVAIPLLGTGRSSGDTEESIEAVVRTLCSYLPSSLEEVHLVTLDKSVTDYMGVICESCASISDGTSDDDVDDDDADDPLTDEEEDILSSTRAYPPPVFDRAPVRSRTIGRGYQHRSDYFKRDMDGQSHNQTTPGGERLQEYFKMVYGDPSHYQKKPAPSPLTHSERLPIHKSRETLEDIPDFAGFKSRDSLFYPSQKPKMKTSQSEEESDDIIQDSQQLRRGIMQDLSDRFRRHREQMEPAVERSTWAQRWDRGVPVDGFLGRGDNRKSSSFSYRRPVDDFDDTEDAYVYEPEIDDNLVQTGNQPKGGTMTVKTLRESLPGHEGDGTIVITYTIPNGFQTTVHPHPGTSFKGINRRAYLPDNEVGRMVLSMLKVAFERRLVFTIGRSRTTGTPDVITWAHISHKSSQTGGPQRYGYPDPEYLNTAINELMNLGVMPPENEGDDMNSLLGSGPST